MRDELYEASRGGGARLNAVPIVRHRVEGAPPVIPGPGAVHGELQAAGLDYVRGPYLPSLAYRLVQVATGGLDAVVVRRGASDWDIAGAAKFGFRTVWINRTNQPDEYTDHAPKVILPSLDRLVASA